MLEIGPNAGTQAGRLYQTSLPRQDERPFDLRRGVRMPQNYCFGREKSCLLLLDMRDCGDKPCLVLIWGMRKHGGVSYNNGDDGSLVASAITLHAL